MKRVISYYLIGIVGLFSINMLADEVADQEGQDENNIIIQDEQGLNLNDQNADLFGEAIKAKLKDLKNWAKTKVQSFTASIGACPAAKQVITAVADLALDKTGAKPATVADKLNMASVAIKQKIYDLGLCKTSATGVATGAVVGAAKMAAQLKQFVTEKLQ